MNVQELHQLGVPQGGATKRAVEFIADFILKGGDSAALADEIQAVLSNPRDFLKDPLRGSFARSILDAPAPLRSKPAPWRQWGEDLDEASIQQLDHACQLPVSVKGALMPDAHVGYGLPIGGVLATDNAVIPYAVGVDIACRMKMTVLDLPLRDLDRKRDRLMQAIEKETRFGIGSNFKDRREHGVMDADWDISPVTKQYKDRAWSQLGTSGSGNHFVEFGTFAAHEPIEGLAPGEYVALLSHSGSRGTGAQVCSHYSQLATQRHSHLPRQFSRLAWLDLDTQEGLEYWEAMELMGRYAAANHELIHQHVARRLGLSVLLDLENHHNFAWKEVHEIDGKPKTLIVHRKGATPAGAGVLGIIPGSMAAPGFVVRGKGHPDSLNSAAHGAGRVMSRKQANQTVSWKEVQRRLKAQNITLMSAGLDEAPMVYKNIHQVMQAQMDLVEVLGQFDPRIVKMAPAGERPED